MTIGSRFTGPVEDRWIILDDVSSGRVRQRDAFDAGQQVIEDEKVGNMDVGKLSAVGTETGKVILQDAVAEMLRRQVEAAFESGAFHLEPGEYLVADLTLRADTPEEIKRTFDVRFELR